MSAKLRITYTKSSIGYSKRQKETVRSLGSPPPAPERDPAG